MACQNDITFTISCTMKKRWVSHFLGMLKRMQQLGGLGGSRDVTFRSDGDGDFRPKFEWGNNLPEPSKPRNETNGDTYFDAG